MSSLKFRGVYPHKDSGWTAAIGHEGKQVYLGWFADFESAKAARLAGELRLFGQVFDRREIECDGVTAKLPLHGQGGVFHGWALIDASDLDATRDIAWTKDARGYVVGRPPGSTNSVTLHRWLLVGGAKGRLIVDHANRDRLDNRRGNLRWANSNGNAQNTSLAKNNSSGFKGVARAARGKWRARIWVDGKERFIGLYDTRDAAAAAYDAEALRLHGEYASPNAALDVSGE
ncbi:HNH endonuclease [Cupriavidus basilensis]|uniref:HNH endonuclease n=1 Tax=Cupriavidus basilensis TaxID=68895 RepID=UPI000A7DCC38|nr:HNH endonuclease [Cupriavidus basilensis]